MNQDLIVRNQVDPAVEGVINSFELGFRMQTALPEVLDLSRESAKTLEAYGIGRGGGGGKIMPGARNWPSAAPLTSLPAESSQISVHTSRVTRTLPSVVHG